MSSLYLQEMTKAIIDQQKILGKNHKISKLTEVASTLGKEIIQICNKVIYEIETFLLPANATSNFALSLFTLLQADMIRYKCECFSTEAERKAFTKEAQYKYNKAIEYAAQMPVTDPHKIALQLNYSTFVFEHLHDRPGAIKLAQKALEDSSLISTDKADDYMDMTRLQKSLKENINQWSHVDE